MGLPEGVTAEDAALLPFIPPLAVRAVVCPVAGMSGIRRETAHQLNLEAVGRMEVVLFGELARRNLYLADLSYLSPDGTRWILQRATLIELWDEVDAELLLSVDLIKHIAYTTGGHVTLSF